MNKQFKKFVDDEGLYKATCDFILDIDRPKYTKEMTFQDYGALCVAYDKFKERLRQKLDDVYRDGQEDVV